MTFVNSEQAKFWSEMAPTWVEIEDRLDEIAGEPGRLAMDRLGLEPGHRVLDVGCGAGGTTLELAGRVTPGGRAVGVDIAAEMLVRARERADEAGASNVDFVNADVQAANDLGDNRFDAAFSRFGVMFFADPVAAFANIRKALRPGGVLSFVCWQGGADNDWMLVPGMAAVSVLGVMPPMPAPDEPGPFSLSDADRVQAILDAAAFLGVDILRHNDVVTTTEERIPEIAALSMRVGAVRELLKDADQAASDKVLAAIEDALRSRVQDGVARLSRGILLVRASA